MRCGACRSPQILGSGRHGVNDDRTGGTVDDADLEKIGGVVGADEPGKPVVEVVHQDRVGEVWLATVGTKRRPVLVLTRPEVLDVRARVTVAEISTSARGLAAEVDVDNNSIGLDRQSVVNCDELHTIDQTTLSAYVGAVDDDTMHRPGFRS